MADSIMVFPPGWRATDVTGAVLSGAKIEFFVETSTPDPSFSDAGLSNDLPNPVICDSGGFPTSDGNAKVLIWRGTQAYRMRLLRADDTTVWDFDGITGALPFSSVSVQDSTRLVGEVVDYLGLTPPSNRWLPLNGKTIGSAASNASARASDSADTLALFTLVWNADSGNKLAITDSAGTPSSKGASAGSDFLANKRLALPNRCGKVSAGADNMGGQVSINLLTGLSGGIDGDIPFNTGGGESVTLSEAQLPVIDPDDKKTDPTHLHTTTQPTGDRGASGGDSPRPLLGAQTVNTGSASTGITFSNIGSGEAHNNVQPTIIVPLVLVYAGVP